MYKLRYKILIFAFITLFSHQSFSEIFHLDNGKTVSGIIISEDEKTITIISPGTQLTLRKDNIENIEKPSVSPQQKLYNEAQVEIVRGNEINALSKCLQAISIMK